MLTFQTWTSNDGHTSESIVMTLLRC